VHLRFPLVVAGGQGGAEFDVIDIGQAGQDEGKRNDEKGQLARGGAEAVFGAELPEGIGDRPGARDEQNSEEDSCVNQHCEEEPGA
jgi:hypothetical protein